MKFPADAEGVKPMTNITKKQDLEFFAVAFLQLLPSLLEKAAVWDSLPNQAGFVRPSIIDFHCTINHNFQCFKKA